MEIIELKNTITKIKNLLGRLNSKIITTEDRINNLQANQYNSTNLNNRFRQNIVKKNEQSLRDL